MYHCNNARKANEASTKKEMSLSVFSYNTSICLQNKQKSIVKQFRITAEFSKMSDHTGYSKDNGLMQSFSLGH